ncbi:MAG: hypothetical protein M1816_005567 [Peltula sp. TS41687]|nr:MAG: hypothetical protein M1816_005567 [Peltula sp. TS41687]
MVTSKKGCDRVRAHAAQAPKLSWHTHAPPDQRSKRTGVGAAAESGDRVQVTAITEAGTDIGTVEEESKMRSQQRRWNWGGESVDGAGQINVQGLDLQEEPLKTNEALTIDTDEREEEKEKENDDDDDNDAEVRRQRPNFQPTGRLAAESNTLAGIVLKYHEPAEARKPAPDAGWRLYVFKGADLLETIELGSRSCWLFGRERTVADFPLDHPSSSKQHAVVQFRYLVKTNEFGDKDGMVRPYLIDLESANGTMVNGDHIPATRYVELRHKDMIQFGLSTREYVLMSAAKE